MMQANQPISGVLLDEVALSLDELARAVNVEPDWVVRHVQMGVLGLDASVQVTTLRFGSRDLDRARRLLGIERAFEANADVAALVIDLGDEIRRLRTRMRALGVE